MSSSCTTSSGPTARRSGCGRGSSSRCTPRRVGKCLLAFAPIAVPRPHELDLQRYTGRTVVAVGTLTEHLAAVRHRGWAAELGEHRTGVGGIAAPLRDRGRAGGRRAGRRGPGRSCSTAAGHRTPRLVEQLLNAAREISAGLGATGERACERTNVTATAQRRPSAARESGDRARRRGDRPGHHLDPLPAVQPGRPDGRGRPARAPPVLPAVGLGRARRRGDLAQRHPDRPRRAAQRRAWARRTSSRWASRTSARRP